MRLSPLTLAAAMVLGAGCGGADADLATIPPQFSEIQAQIFTPNCTLASCHGAAAQEGLSLVAPARAAIVGVPSTEVAGMMRVAPGDPDASYLLHKIADASPADGDRMPPDQPLPAYKIEAVRRWIAAGAQDD